AEEEKPDPRVARRLVGDDRLGAVGTGIEAEDDFIGPDALEHRTQAGEKGADIVLFPIDRNDDRNPGDRFLVHAHHRFWDNLDVEQPDDEWNVSTSGFARRSRQRERLFTHNPQGQVKRSTRSACAAAEKTGRRRTPDWTFRDEDTKHSAPDAARIGVRGPLGMPR